MDDLEQRIDKYLEDNNLLAPKHGWFDADWRQVVARDIANLCRER